MKPDDKKRSLDDPKNVTLMYRALIAVCILLVLADLFYDKHVHYGFESWFGIYGAYGFVSCVGLVLVAKELRRVLKRDEDYYD